MGETHELTSELRLAELRRKWEREARKLARSAENVVPMWDDETDVNELCWPANDNRLAGLARNYRLELAA
jgi:hypothetical protein